MNWSNCLRTPAHVREQWASIIPYDDEDDAVRIANDTRFGLSGAVWSADEQRAVRVARRINTGQVDVNGGAFNPLAPSAESSAPATDANSAYTDSKNSSYSSQFSPRARRAVRTKRCCANRRCRPRSSAAA